MFLLYFDILNCQHPTASLAKRCGNIPASFIYFSRLSYTNNTWCKLYINKLHFVQQCLVRLTYRLFCYSNLTNLLLYASCLNLQSLYLQVKYNRKTHKHQYVLHYLELLRFKAPYNGGMHFPQYNLQYLELQCF